mgnify:CR=1 FL=1
MAEGDNVKTGAEEKPKMTADEKLGILSDVVMTLVEKVEDLAGRVESGAGAKKESKGLFGGKRTAVPIKDLKTGVVYRSMAHVNKVFGPEVGIDPKENSMGYYTIEKKLLMPDGSKRFVPANADEAAAARAAYDAEIKKAIDEQNAKFAEEEAKKATGAATQPAEASKPKQDKKPKK